MARVSRGETGTETAVQASSLSGRRHNDCTSLLVQMLERSMLLRAQERGLLGGTKLTRERLVVQRGGAAAK